MTTIVSITDPDGIGSQRGSLTDIPLIHDRTNNRVGFVDIQGVFHPFAEGPAAGATVGVTVNDTTAGFLDQKLVAGDGITLTVLNPGGNEQLQISSSGGVGPGVIGQLAVYNSASTVIGTPRFSQTANTTDVNGLNVNIGTDAATTDFVNLGNNTPGTQTYILSPQLFAPFLTGAGNPGNVATVGAAGEITFQPVPASSSPFVAGTGANSARLNGGGSLSAGALAVSIGTSNQANGLNSFAGGNQSTATGANSFAFGSLNIAVSARSVVIGGNGNVTNSVDSAILGGSFNTVSTNAIQAAIVGGNQHSVQGDNSAAIGGTLNIILAAADRSVILGGTGRTEAAPDVVNVPNIRITPTEGLGAAGDVLTNNAGDGRGVWVTPLTPAFIVGAGANSAILNGSGSTAAGITSVSAGSANFADGNNSAAIGGGSNGVDAAAVDSGTYAGSGNTINGVSGQSVILGGGGNEINNANEASIMGGNGNTVEGLRASIIGGAANQASSTSSAIISSNGATIDAGSLRATIIGSSSSAIQTGSPNAVIIGGVGNVTSASPSSVIAGGSSNTNTDADESVILGGTGNTNEANGTMIAASTGSSSTTGENFSAVIGCSNCIVSSTNGVILGATSLTNTEDNTTMMQSTRITQDFRVPVAPNRFVGTGTLTGGTAIVANTSVQAGARIFTQITNPITPGILFVTDAQIIAGVGFTVDSTEVGDGSDFNYFIVNP